MKILPWLAGFTARYRRVFQDTQAEPFQRYLNGHATFMEAATEQMDELMAGYEDAARKDAARAKDVEEDRVLLSPTAAKRLQDALDAHEDVEAVVRTLLAEYAAQLDPDVADETPAPPPPSARLA